MHAQLLARLPDPHRSDRDRLPVRAGPGLVHLCPADVDRGRCHRRPRPGLLKGLVRAVVLAWAVVHHATPDRVWVVLCIAVRLQTPGGGIGILRANIESLVRILRFILLILAVFEYKYEIDQDRVLAAERECLLPR